MGMRKVFRCLLSIALAAFAGAARAAPMDYWITSGPAADPTARLGWGLSAISAIVCVVVGVLVLAGIFRRRPPLAPDQQGRLPVLPSRGGMRWIYVGSAITVVVLLGTAVWNSVTLAAVATPPRDSAMTIEVTGKQWWWEVRYLDEQPSRIVTTANEIHIPTGVPVRFKLVSGDVIHSFWIPQLGGKTDLIPGQTNFTWLQADRPGRYRGQCAEFCGSQHAHMMLYVVAQEPAAFAAWRAAQMAQAPPPATPQAARGLAVFESRCAVCHTVRNDAFLTAGRFGPDLTHLMSRETIGAGLLANNSGNLHGWIANPDALKPGTRMPPVPLPPEDLHAVVAYLQTLK